MGVMDDHSEFKRYADLAKKIYDHVAVCRNKHGTEDIFHIVFEDGEQLGDFLMRNNGDVHKIGFYAKGFSNGEYIGENT